MPAEAFKHLLSPGRIGPLELRNRIIVTAMGVNLAEPDGTCGQRIRAFQSGLYVRPIRITKPSIPEAAGFD